MIFATDLDRTLIFSSKFLPNSKKSIICVEKKEDKEISFMLKETYNQFENLKKSSGLYVIPVTTRSLEQYKRVEAVQDCKFAITTNGGIILYNGEVFKPWRDKVSKKIDSIQENYLFLENLLKEKEDYFTSSLKLVDNIFYYVKIKEECYSSIVEYLDTFLDSNIWNYTIQGLKLYVIPKGITKEDALEFLKDYLNIQELVVSGDGKLDLGFLKLGSLTIIPDRSEVLKYITDDMPYIKTPYGLDGTSTLLKAVELNYKVRGGIQ